MERGQRKAEHSPPSVLGSWLVFGSPLQALGFCQGDLKIRSGLCPHLSWSQRGWAESPAPRHAPPFRQLWSNAEPERNLGALRCCHAVCARRACHWRNPAMRAHHKCRVPDPRSRSAPLRALERVRRSWGRNRHRVAVGLVGSGTVDHLLYHNRIAG